MDDLILIQSTPFGAVTCDFYQKDNEIWMTREQIGAALEYSEPRKAISDIHNRHKERLDRFSVVSKLRTTDGKSYETYLYSAKGVYEICRWSQQPKADVFYDWVYEILEGLRTGRLAITPTYLTPGAQKLDAELTLQHKYLDLVDRLSSTKTSKQAKRKLYSDSLTQFAAATGIDCNLFIEALNQTPSRKPRGPYKPREAKGSRITGERVYTARILQGWSQRALAGKLGTSNSFVWFVERDERAVTVEMQSRLLNVLDMTLPELLALPTVLMDGERFAAARVHIARALEEIAESLGVSKETLESIENDTAIITPELQTDFLRYAHLTLEELKELPAAPWQLIPKE